MSSLEGLREIRALRMLFYQGGERADHADSLPTRPYLQPQPAQGDVMATIRYNLKTREITVTPAETRTP